MPKRWVSFMVMRVSSAAMSATLFEHLDGARAHIPQVSDGRGDYVQHSFSLQLLHHAQCGAVGAGIAAQLLRRGLDGSAAHHARNGHAPQVQIGALGGQMQGFCIVRNTRFTMRSSME